MRVILTDEFDHYKDVLNKRIVDCLCKHVCIINSEKSRQMLYVAEDAGIDKVKWGYGEGLYSVYDNGLHIHLSRIGRMIYKHILRPVRVVIDTEGYAWVDNMHTAIAFILARGSNITLGDIDCYIIDMRDADYPVICSINDSVVLTSENVNSLIDKGFSRLSRTDARFYAIGYTIGDFLADNNITRERLSINESYYEKF